MNSKGCLLLLSNSDTPFIRDLYSDFSIKKVDAQRAINCKSSKRAGHPLLFSLFPSPTYPLALVTSPTVVVITILLVLLPTCSQYQLLHFLSCFCICVVLLSDFSAGVFLFPPCSLSSFVLILFSPHLFLFLLLSVFRLSCFASTLPCSCVAFRSACPFSFFLSVCVVPPLLTCLFPGLPFFGSCCFLVLLFTLLLLSWRLFCLVLVRGFCVLVSLSCFDVSFSVCIFFLVSPYLLVSSVVVFY